MAFMSEPIFHLSDRAVISIHGPDTRDFLQRVVTNDMKLCFPGTIQVGALLTPQGKIVCDFQIHGEKNGVELDIWADAADVLIKRLTLYRLRANAEISLDMGAFVISGKGSADPRSSDLPQRSIATEKPGADGANRQVESEISSGIPSFGRDYGEASVFPTDVNLDLYGGIGWKKGCFIGQEVLSRMKRRGTIRKRTVSVSSKDRAMTVGETIMAGDIPLGAITSSTGKSALAIVRLDRFQAATASPTIDGAVVTINTPLLAED